MKHTVFVTRSGAIVAHPDGSNCACGLAEWLGLAGTPIEPGHYSVRVSGGCWAFRRLSEVTA